MFSSVDLHEYTLAFNFSCSNFCFSLSNKYVNLFKKKHLPSFLVQEAEFLFIYLKGRFGETEKDLLSVDWLPKRLQQPKLSQPEARSLSRTAASQGFGLSQASNRELSFSPSCFSLFLFFLAFFFFLKFERQSLRRTEKYSICWFTLQMVLRARIGPG